MRKKPTIFPLAIRDIQNGIDYYRQQQKGLGKKFESEVHGAIKKIEKHPSSASFAYSDVRYHVLDKFPYIILYQYDDMGLYILRIFNTHQIPQY